MALSFFTSVSLVARKKKNNPNLANIYLRLKIKTRAKEKSTKITIDFDKWDPKAEKIKGHQIQVKKENFKLAKLKKEVYDLLLNLESEDKLITHHLVFSRLDGTDTQHKTLHDIFQYHKDVEAMKLSGGTLKNYSKTEDYLYEFIKQKMNTTNLFIKEIDYAFLNELEAFLRTKKSLSNNGVMKHMERFLKLINLAYKLDWIDKNPTKSYSLHYEKVDMSFLNTKELKEIEDFTFTKKQLSINRDLFIFSCYTGLAYGDLYLLTHDNIKLGIDGNKWLHFRRVKSKTNVRVPLLDKALEIINKYKGHPKTRNSDQLLPVYSNQATNRYLKEIAQITKIDKKISFHTARHTFATTVTLLNGVPFETVSKMLGHTKLSTTSIYARVIDSKVATDFDTLKNKLNKQQNKSAG